MYIQNDGIDGTVYSDLEQSQLTMKSGHQVAWQ